jgi:hypothetical protein
MSHCTVTGCRKPSTIVIATRKLELCDEHWEAQCEHDDEMQREAMEEDYARDPIERKRGRRMYEEMDEPGEAWEPRR